MQQDILSTTKEIAKNAKFVSINKDAIENFCVSFSAEDGTVTELGDTAGLDISESIGLICVFNCINFCFWARLGEEKWATKVGGELIDGSTGLFRALEEAYKNGSPLLDAQFLQDLNLRGLEKLLNGNTRIPLLDERIKCLREAGEVLLKKFEGSFMKVFESSGRDGVELTNLFIRFFSSFNDYVMFGGKKVEFHKRAQLNTDMINCYLAKQGEKELSNLDKLTAFADYKVPQILRKFGILEYVPELAVKIDSYEEIEAGSEEELEIRAATIWSIEEMKEYLRPRVPQVTARQLDNHLWNLGQAKSPEDKPYHRTRTIFY